MGGCGSSTSRSSPATRTCGPNPPRRRSLRPRSVLDPDVTLGSMVRGMDTSTEPRSFTVGAAARVAGVTVRTLHHYHEIGLLAPSDRSDAGYRRYADRALEGPQRVLFYPGPGL